MEEGPAPLPPSPPILPDGPRVETSVAIEGVVPTPAEVSITARPPTWADRLDGESIESRRLPEASAVEDLGLRGRTIF